MAVLVAIAIPVFTGQLEKSKEATDAANIRAAYAELMVIAIDDGTTTETKTVALKQQDTNWKNKELSAGLKTVFNGQSDIEGQLAKAGKDKTATLSWVAGTGTADGYASLAIN